MKTIFLIFIVLISFSLFSGESDLAGIGPGFKSYVSFPIKKDNAIKIDSIKMNGKEFSVLSSEANYIHLYRSYYHDKKSLPLESDVTHADFSPDGKWILGMDESVHIWDHKGNIQGIFSDYNSYVSNIGMSPDGKHIQATNLEDGSIKIWRKDGTLIKQIKNGMNTFSIFSSDSKYILSATMDFKLRMQSLEGKMVKTFKSHEATITGISFSPDGKQIASATSDGLIRITNLEGKTKQLNADSINFDSVAFSPDSAYIIGGSRQGQVLIWNREGKLIKRIYAHASSIKGFSFSRNGKYFATFSTDKSARIWDFHSGALLLAVFAFSGGEFVTISPDGRYECTSEMVKENLRFEVPIDEIPEKTLITKVEVNEGNYTKGLSERVFYSKKEEE